MSLSVFLYKFISKKSSMKQLVVKSFNKMLINTDIYLDIPKVGLFAKFLNISGNFDEKCFEIF